MAGGIRQIYPPSRSLHLGTSAVCRYIYRHVPSVRALAAADMHSGRQSPGGSHRARDSPGSCVLWYICKCREFTSQFSWLLTVCVSILGPVELTRLLPVRRCAFLNFVEQVCVSDLGCSIYVLVLTCLNSIVRCVSNRVCVCIQRYSCL